MPRVSIHPPDAATVRNLLAAAENHAPIMACWLQLAAATGARRGEICGLRWGDIDYGQRSVRIERSVSATTASGVFVKTTKTCGVRRVTITAQALGALQAQYERAESSARECAPVAAALGALVIPASSPGLYGDREALLSTSRACGAEARIGRAHRREPRLTVVVAEVSTGSR